jgi:hypothetical protein
MAFSYSPKIVTDGLVLYLDVANIRSYVSGSTIWNDISRGGNNGTLVNGPTFNSANGGSIVFDGTNDLCALPNTSLLSAGTGDFTFNCWIYPNSWPVSNWSPIFVAALTNGMWIGQNNSNQFVLRAYGVADRLQFNTRPTTGTWTLVTITRIGTTATLYYNGVSQTSSTTNQDFVQGTTYVANDGPGAGAVYFNGRISNLLFYKGKGLTAAEVLQNYNATKGRFL